MPYQIEGTYVPSWAKTEESNKKYLDFLKTRNPVKLQDYHTLDFTFDIMTTRVNDNQLLWIEDDGLIQYCVEVKDLETKNVVNVKAVCQTSVWRNKLFYGLTNFAEFVFFRILLPKYGNILSDGFQSDDGKRFWSARVYDALVNSEEYHVYSLSLLGYENLTVYQAERVLGLKNFEDYYTTDSDLSGQFVRLLITKEPLVISSFD